jgi:Holliday junction DNA helicase RuvA
MIGWLKGAVRFRREGRLIIDVGGVGYEVRVPAGVAADVALGDTVELHIHTHVREDQLALFGFETIEQMAAFHSLLSVTGIGPKVAVAILGGISTPELTVAVESGDIARLTALPGVGKRLAQRLSMELKGKLAPAAGVVATSLTAAGNPAKGPFADLESALSNLGFRPREIGQVVVELRQEMPEADLDTLIRSALGRLSK